MKAIIVDDVKDDIQLIAQILATKCPEVKNVGEATTLREAERLILEQKPDLVFLDIQFDPEGATCFQLLERLGKENLTFEIIFITGYDKTDYRTKAMQFASLDFIEKVVDPNRLKAAVEKAQQRRATGLYPQQIDLFMRLLKQVADTYDKIAIPLLGGEGKIVDIKEILKIEADGSMTKIYLNSSFKPLISVKNLGTYEEQLHEYHFSRIHDKILLNLEYVTTWNREGSLKLKNGESVFASRRNFTVTKKALEKLHQNPMLNFLNRLLGKS
jgi:two-component system, LytTR family, response regulator